MRNRFDRELVSLNEQLTQMGQLCETAIENATKALQDGDMEKAKLVIEKDAEIDQSERDIERLCLKLLLQTSDIAEIIISAKISETTDFPKIGEMSREAQRMVTDSVSAYVNRDMELAGRVEANDDVVDLLFESVKKELIERIAQSSGRDLTSAQHAIDVRN